MTIVPYSIELDTITAHIHAHPVLRFSSEIAVVFLLHGYPSSARHMQPVLNGVFGLITEKVETAGISLKPNLVIVTLELEPENERNKVNDLEPERLYRQQERIAESVSTLIDRLPAVLSPNYDKSVTTWMVAGVSLGAHAAWMAMDRDPRLSACIPILGSPDFLDIATCRSGAISVVPLVSSIMSASTRRHIIKHDPVSRRRNSLQEISFTNRHVLALAGAQDGMVSVLATRSFLDRIDVGPTGTKRLVIQQGVGHQCTKEMIKEMADLVWKVGMVREG